MASFGGDESTTPQSESQDTPREPAGLLDDNDQAFDEEPSREVGSAVPGDQGEEDGESIGIGEERLTSSESKRDERTGSILRTEAEEPVASADDQDPALHADNVVATFAGFHEEAKGYLPKIRACLETLQADPSQHEAMEEAHRLVHSI